MSKKDEDVGKAVLSAVKSSVKDSGGGELVGAAKNLNDMLNQAIEMQQTLTISLYRTNQFTQQDEFLSQINDVPPAMIKEQGLEPIIQNWSGGGAYRGVIRGSGIPDKKFNVVIGGDPELPRPSRTNTPGDNAGLQGLPGGAPGAAQMNAPFNQGGGNFLAGPGFANYLGFNQRPWGGGGGGQESQVAMMQANQIQQLIATLMASKNSGGDSDAVQLAKEDNRKMEAQMVEERRRAEQDKADARHREEMAEMRRGMEELAKNVATPKEDPTVAMFKAVVPLATIALPMMMDGKSKAASAQSDMFKAMMGTQKESSDKSLGMMEIMMKQPTAEDRQAKQADTVANLMGNTMQLMGSFTSQMAAMQGDGGPPWFQIVSKLLDGVTEVGANMFAGGMPQGQEEVAGQASVQQPSPQQLDAANAAQQARAAMEAAASPSSDDAEEKESDGAMGGMETPPRESYHQGLQKIFELIENDGSPHVIAFRIWKDGTSGDVTSLAWFKQPEHFTFSLLGGFVDADQMDITEERATEIADALQEYHDHLKAGGTPDAYRQTYDIRVTLPKKIMRDPVNMDGKDQPLMGEPAEGGQVIDIKDVEVTEEKVIPLPQGPQNAPPPKKPGEEKVEVVEGPQNEPPPTAAEAIVEVKKIENGVDKSEDKEDKAGN